MKTTLCEQWAQRDSKVMAVCGKIAYYPFVIAKGAGAIVEDIDGNSFIDLFASAACMNLGYAHPEIVAAMQEQITACSHYTTAYFYNKKATEFAEKLVAITPGAYDKKVAFGLTGSDANDGAIKFARGFTRRSKIISFNGAYHGSTYGALAISRISLNMHRKIGPTMPDAYSFDFPNVYRNGPDDGDRCLQQIQDAFATFLPPDDVAAVFVEPIQGDSGILIPPHKFMHDLYTLCQKHGILFISEEVQQGFFRTGKWFGIDHFGIEPDITVLGKPIGGGMPLSAVVGRAAIMDTLGPPAHAFTFAGNPVSCAAGSAAIDILSQPDFSAAVNAKGALAKKLFAAMQEKYDLIGDIRGLGLSMGIELVENRQSKQPALQAAAKICYRAWEKGVILVTLAGNVLRIQPPLVITEDEIKKAANIIDSCIADYLRGDIPDSVLDVVKGW